MDPLVKIKLNANLWDEPSHSMANVSSVYVYRQPLFRLGWNEFDFISVINCRNHWNWLSEVLNDLKIDTLALLESHIYSPMKGKQFSHHRKMTTYIPRLFLFLYFLINRFCYFCTVKMSWVVIKNVVEPHGIY